MNEAIIKELDLFLISILWGSILLIIYDSLRIFRKLIKHNNCTRSLEDILYWILSGFLIFKMMYKHNNGIIRGFTILGMFLGMIIYKILLSDFLVKNISALLIKIKKLIISILSTIIRPLSWLKDIINKTIGIIIRKFLGKIKKSVYISIKALKTRLKSSKISLDDVGDGDLSNYEKKKEE